ncbi:IS66 family transposase [Methylohalobius crimeensis]|uniref:IS66 family transposase n=1 Tax=Methylohalobius crimeensis TaxID=244365 RepID=UPI0003B41961|nr:hypothetical protein [Methylohalobius crimeensis]
MTALPTPSLPDDIDALKALLLEKEQRIHLLEEQLRLLKHQRFGHRSEKSDRQGELFNEAEIDEAADAASAEAPPSPLPTRPRSRAQAAAGRAAAGAHRARYE